LNYSINDLLPFAVVGSTDFVKVGNKLIRARRYPWGVVEGNHNNIKLRGLEEPGFKGTRVWGCLRVNLDKLVQNFVRKNDLRVSRQYCKVLSWLHEHLLRKQMYVV